MISYQIKTINKDFSVTEIFPLELDSGKYSYYLLKKSGLRTTDVIDIVSRKLEVEKSSISYAGLKDEDAVTVQYVAIKDKTITSFSYKEPQGHFSLIHVGNSSKPMEIGRLFGNAFKIRIRNLSLEDAKSVSKFSKKEISFLNYYYIQRFGKPNMPKKSHLVGKALLEENYHTAFELLFQMGNISKDDYSKYKHNCKKFLLSYDLRKLNFFLGAWDSYVWNNKINECICSNQKQYEKIVHEDIEFCYAPIDEKMENQLKNISIKRHIFSDNAEIIEKDSFRQPYIHTVIKTSDVFEDDINKERYMIDIFFMLPAGCYATALIDQLVWKIK